MKIQQMAFMLMAIFAFFVLVGLFVLMFRSAGLKETALALDEKNSLLLVTSIANSPEFSCGNSYGSGKSNCVDAYKLFALEGSIGKYAGFWGSGIQNILIRKLPINGSTICSSGNYPECDVIDLFSKGAKGFPVENFVTLCGKERSDKGLYDKCEIAKVVAYYDEKQ